MRVGQIAAGALSGKFSFLAGFALVIRLYQVFVLMSLWNWFVARAFHVGEISFLAMLGISWFVQLIIDKPNRDEPLLWDWALELIDLCIPKEKRDEARGVTERMKSDIKGMMWEGAVGRVFSITLTLAFGFVVHLLI